MPTVLGRSLALALGGLAAGFALVFAFFGGDLRERWAGTVPAATIPDARKEAGDAPAPGVAPETRSDRPDGSGGPVAALPLATQPGTAPADGAGPRTEARRETVPEGGPADGLASKPAERAAGAEPSFDIVRVEPNGESVVAGRAAPHALVEMLVDGRAVARAQADANGQFALVPPALPAGNSEIGLRQTGADGRQTRSRQSVAVALAGGGKPLVALSMPDAPTVVLSRPDPAPPGAAANTQPKVAALPPAKTPGERAGKVAGNTSDKVSTSRGADPVRGGDKAQGSARVVSVDSEGGRLFVGGEAAPGAAVRLYLNDTLIAPGRAGADGRVSFTIGRGVRPGGYKVRLDQVDPDSGKVVARAEVPFTVPETTARVARAAPPPAQEPPAATARAIPDPAQPVSPGASVARPEATANASDAREVAKPREEVKAREVAKPLEALKPREAASAREEAKLQAARPGEGRTEQAERKADPAAPASPSGAARPEVAAGVAQPATRLPGAQPLTPAQPPAIASAGPESVFVAEINTAKITRGDSLWQISRRAYGKGDRYTVIYDANQEQIRDPDLIYPGQIFVLPEDAKTARKRG